VADVNTNKTEATMPAVQVHGPGVAQVDRIAVPSPGPDDVLVAVEYCGICGSDLGYIGMGSMAGGDRPMPLGHELSGVVVETGNRVSATRSGDRVVVNPMANGNTIGNGGPEGAFAPLLLVRNAEKNESSLFKLPESLGMEEGALVEPLAVGMHVAKQGKAQAGDRAVIMGAGPIGLCTLLVLRHLGLENIVVVDLSAKRLAMAAQLGGTVFCPDQDDPTSLPTFLLKQHGAAELMGGPVPASELYVEATGVGSVFTQVVHQARSGARVVVAGLHKAPVAVDMVNLLMRELVVTGSMAYPDEFPDVIEMLAAGQVDASALVSHRFALAEFERALATAQDPDEAIKVLVDCRPEEN